MDVLKNHGRKAEDGESATRRAFYAMKLPWASISPSVLRLMSTAHQIRASLKITKSSH